MGKPGKEMSKHYSIADIARELSLPESTVRYYRDRFKNYVPAVKKGGRKVYDDRALEALRMAAEGLRKGETAAAVEDQLSYYFSQTLDIEEETAAVKQQDRSSALTIYEAQICSLLEVIKERDEAVKRRDEIMLQLLRQLREKEAQLRYYQLPWWRKLF
jgi:DNA-binding transcriptional MerR regulator